MNYRAITGQLVARTSLHIGSAQVSEVSDALLRRNVGGEIFIPGTAIAGALRSLVTRLAPRLTEEQTICKALRKPNPKDDKRYEHLDPTQIDDGNPCGCPVCQLFGDVNQSDEADSQTGASRVRVYDAYPSQPLKRGQVRDSVGIDRRTGAAARASMSKFDLEALNVPDGCSFKLRIELHHSVTDEEERLLASALAEWQGRRLWLGGRVARGMGAFALADTTLVTHDLTTSTGIMAFLTTSTPWEIAKDTPQIAHTDAQWISNIVKDITTVQPAPANSTTVARNWVQVEFTLEATGNILSNDMLSSAESGFDHAPLLVSLNDWQHPILPGASLRGVLRSHAERIARTLATHAAWQYPENQREKHFRDICPACNPLARRKDKTASVPLESCDSLLRYEKNFDGNARIDEEQLCLACRLFGSTRRGSRLLVEDAPFTGGIPQYKMLDFLAIDRFTGGGADKLKFDALALWKPTFRVRLFLDNPQSWELGWLALVLRDMRDGMLSIGYGAAKGFGAVTIADDWHMTLSLLNAAMDFPLSDHSTEREKVQPATGRLIATGTREQSVYTELHYVKEHQYDWLTIAEHWVQSFITTVRSGNGRSTTMSLPKDSYFDGDNLTTLYPALLEEQA